jgi:four helix bundle protein
VSAGNSGRQEYGKLEEERFHRPHKKLEVWKLSMELCREVYDLTAKLPENEKYGLVSQIRRAAVSVPSNISEGAARNTKAEFDHFLSIARGSLAELDTQLQLCTIYLNFLTEKQVIPVLEKSSA